jgi:putative two-component system response regulator
VSRPLDGYARHRHLDFPFHAGEMPPLFGATDSLLVVDDDPATAALLVAMLEPEGYRCAIASDADEAMQMLHDDEFAVALVDILMPGETGLELVERVLDVHPFLAIVMVTGVDDPRIAELALQSGAFGYLIKPFTHNEVVVAVSNAGRRRCLEIESAVYRRRLETHVEEQAADLEDALRQLKELHERGLDGDDG